MKVLHINTSYGQGGAAKFMLLLSENLTAKFGVENYHIVSYAATDLKNNSVEILEDNEWFLFGQRKLSRILKEQGFPDLYLPSGMKYIRKRINELNPDIIHLNNIHGEYFQMNLLKKISQEIPVIWTFHDMFPFTGHCAHSFECDKWVNGCDKCPYLSTYPPLLKDRTRMLWKYKRNLYSNSEFEIVTPSLWLYEKVKKSFLRGKKIHHVWNGVSILKFHRTEQFKARKELSLPCDVKIILFSAHRSTDNIFKGGQFVQNIYNRLNFEDDIVFLNVGGISENGRQEKRWIDIGYVESEDKMALLYSAADIFLYPTLADNCPLSVIEAMSCGLPVVTFQTGGVPEMVEHMKTGYIARYMDGEDLLKGVKLLLGDKKLREGFGCEGEKRVKDKFNVDDMTEKYFKIYNNILKGGN